MPAGWMKRLVEEREAHVWHVRLDVLHPASAQLQRWLSAEETARAARIIEPLQRARFIAVRAAVRGVLATYTGSNAASLMLQREPGGKPVLTGADVPHFSLTHSGALAAVAVAAFPLGVDLEHVRELRHARAARRILHRETLSAIDALPAAIRMEALIDAWTLREAHVKAVGGGMFRTPDTIPFEPRAGSGLSRVHGRDGEEWSVLRWSPAPGVRAALAARGMLAAVSHMEWDPGMDDVQEEG